MSDSDSDSDHYRFIWGVHWHYSNLWRYITNIKFADDVELVAGSIYERVDLTRRHDLTAR